MHAGTRSKREMDDSSKEEGGKNPCEVAGDNDD